MSEKSSQPSTILPTLDLQTTTSTSFQDQIGIIASVACAIYCAAMPMVIAFLPTLGLNFLADESFHKRMALVCFLIAIAAFVPGFRKHRRRLPISIAVAGIFLITSAAFGIEGDCCSACADAASAAAPTEACSEACCDHCTAELQQSQTIVATASSDANLVQTTLAPIAAWITPLGGILLVTAHLLNHRYGCLCGCCPTQETTSQETRLIRLKGAREVFKACSSVQ